MDSFRDTRYANLPRIKYVIGIAVIVTITFITLFSTTPEFPQEVLKKENNITRH